MSATVPEVNPSTPASDERLHEGSEILAGNAEELFPTAYSTFAISVAKTDAHLRNAATTAGNSVDPRCTSTASGFNGSSGKPGAVSRNLAKEWQGDRRKGSQSYVGPMPPSAMKHARTPSTDPAYFARTCQQPPSYLSTVQEREEQVQDEESPTKRGFNVRWGQSKEIPYYRGHYSFDDAYNRELPNSHRPRRRSTLAFIEYIHNYLSSNAHNLPGGRVQVVLTPKRAIMLFMIVFAATYCALALLPYAVNGSSGRSGVRVHRSAGYYGNSHIFQGGDNLRDPHAEGDEHSHHATDHGNQQYRGYIAPDSAADALAYVGDVEPMLIQDVRQKGKGRVNSANNGGKRRTSSSSSSSSSSSEGSSGSSSYKSSGSSTGSNKDIGRPMQRKLKSSTLHEEAELRSEGDHAIDNGVHAAFADSGRRPPLGLNKIKQRYERDARAEQDGSNDAQASVEEEREEEEEVSASTPGPAAGQSGKTRWTSFAERDSGTPREYRRWGQRDTHVRDEE